LGIDVEYGFIETVHPASTIWRAGAQIRSHGKRSLRRILRYRG